MNSLDFGLILSFVSSELTSPFLPATTGIGNIALYQVPRGHVIALFQGLCFKSCVAPWNLKYNWQKWKQQGLYSR